MWYVLRYAFNLHALYNLDKMKKPAFLFLLFASLAFVFGIGSNAAVECAAEAPTSSLANPRAKHDDKEDIEYRDDIPILVKPDHNPQTRTWYGVYSDEIFFADSTKYHHFLAKQSIGMALSAFFYNQNDDQSPKSTVDSPGVIFDYLFECGFDRIRVDDYEKETSIWTIGSAIARKTVTKGNQKADVIAVAIRGGNYNREWESNLTLGLGIRHEGFDYAANMVTDRVLSYLKQNTFENPIKIWVTGFSRAGAVSNLVAANLIDRAGYSKEQVYAYTFAAPAALYDIDGSVEKDYPAFLERYAYIHNVIGASDFIPQFVPREWYYYRYGIDHMITGAEFDSGFNAKYKLIQQKVQSYGGETYYNPEFNMRLRLLYGLLLELADDEFMFVSLLQPIFLRVLRDSSAGSILLLVREIIAEFAANPAIADKKDAVIDYAMTLLVPMLTGGGFMEGQTPTAASRALLLAHEHFPDVYFLWMYSFEPEQLFAAERDFDYVFVRGGSYRLIDRATNETLYTVNNGKKELSAYAKANNLDYPVFNVNGNTVLVIPHDRETTLRYSLGAGETLDALTVPYDAFYRSRLRGYSFQCGVNDPREGVLDIGAGTPAGTEGNVLPSAIIERLQIARLGMSYRVYILLLGFAIGLVAVVIAIAVSILQRKLIRAKIHWGKLGLLSLALIAVAQGEIAFWFSPDLMWISLMCKGIAAVCFLLMYILGKKPSEFRFPHRTLLPFLAFFIAANIVVSVSSVAGLILYILAGSFLCYYNLQRKNMPPNVWVIYGLLALIALGVSAVLIRPSDPTGFLFVFLLPEVLLCAFSGTFHGGKRQGVAYLFFFAIIALGMYYFVPSISLFASIVYVILANASLVLFVSDFDFPSRDNGVNKEIAAAPAEESVSR